MTVNMTKVWDTFGFGEIAEVAEDILSRMDAPYDDDLFDAIDSGLIWTKDQWTVLAHYCTPATADWDAAMEEFTEDLLTAIHRGAVETEEED